MGIIGNYTGSMAYVDGSTMYVLLDAEFDHHSSEKIKDISDEHIEKSRIKNIVFDFKNVRFMDSSGVGLIIGRYKKLHYTGGKVGVRNVSPQIDRIMRISGLYNIVYVEKQNKRSSENVEK